MDARATTRLLRAAHTVVHTAAPNDSPDMVLERIVAVMVDEAADCLTTVTVEAVNPKGKVAYAACSGAVPDGLEPGVAMTAMMKPVPGDSMSIRWTVVDARTPPHRSHPCAAPTPDVLHVLTHMTTVVALAVELVSLRAAIGHRDELGTAKGMLMERNNINADAAFALLARYSQDTNTRVAVVAQRVIAAR